MALSDTQIIDLVKKSGTLDEAALAKAENFAVGTKAQNLVTSFIESGVLTEEQLSAIIAGYYKVPYITLAKVSIPEDVAHLIPEKVARKQKAIAFARDANGVKVATNDPANTAIVGLLERKTGEKVSVYYSGSNDIEGTIQLYKKALQKP